MSRFDAALPDMKYTICFCISGSDVLMIQRKRAPNLNRWNGLGGKIEPGESALVNVVREMREEAAIDLIASTRLAFRGIVTWNLQPGTVQEQGMYVFVARLANAEARRAPLLDCDEGTLCWKPIEWVGDPANDAVADNLPYFLPRLLEDLGSLWVRCTYDTHRLLDVTLDRLPPELGPPTRSVNHQCHTRKPVSDTTPGSASARAAKDCIRQAPRSAQTLSIFR